jgi:hypothetical protein
VKFNYFQDDDSDIAEIYLSGLRHDNEAALDVDRIDWRQAVITSEILNRKY